MQCGGIEHNQQKPKGVQCVYKRVNSTLSGLLVTEYLFIGVSPGAIQLYPLQGNF